MEIWRWDEKVVLKITPKALLIKSFWVVYINMDLADFLKRPVLQGSVFT